MQDFRKLLVWQKAHDLVLLTYRITANFPREETFGLRNSLRQTSVNVPSNVAEGAGKSNDADFGRSLSVALGYANRLEYLALLAHDLQLLGQQQHENYQDAIVVVKKMLNKFGRHLRTE